MIRQDSNKENQSENLYTSTSQDSEYQMKNAFMKIQLIDSAKFSTSLDQLDKGSQSEVREDYFKQKEIMESLQRRSKLQLKKEKEFFAIIQTKLKQQIEFLSEQNLNLKHQNKDLSKKLKQCILTSELQSKVSDQTSPLNVSQIKNLRNMLSTLQKEHENCISNKKELIDTKQTLEMKIILLEKENKQLELQYKNFKKRTEEFSQIQTQNINLKNEVQILRKELISLRVINQQQEKQFSKQLSLLQKAIQEIRSKTLAPEISQKLISFANEETISAIKEHHLRKISNFAEQKVNLEGSTDRNTSVSTFSETNRFFTNSFQKSSFAPQTISYPREKNEADKQIIQGLYKKNLAFLNQSHEIQRFKQLNPNFSSNNCENIQPQKNFGIFSTRNQSSRVRGPSSTKREISISNNFGSKNRRFQYL